MNNMKNYIQAIGLLQHIRESNAKTRAWVNEDPENRWATYPVADLESLHDRGIFTVDDYELYNLWACAYDMHKDVYGYKPRWWATWDKWTMEDLQKEIEIMQEEWKQEEKRLLEAEERKKQDEIDHKNAVKNAMKPATWTIGDLISII